MNKQTLLKSAPHVVAILIFVVISFGYFLPVLQEKKLVGHDSENWMYMSKETLDFNKTHDNPTLWTNSMFGGMPTFQISMVQPNNLVKYVEDFLHIFPNTVFYLMLYFIGFYIMLLTFRVNPWLAIIGSFAFAFASYNFIIIAVGHNSKAITIAYMAPMIGSVFLTFRDKIWTGGLLTAIFTSLAIRANHVQIIYYTVFILLIFGIIELIYCIKDKKMIAFLKSTGVVAVALIIAIGMNATTLITTYDYTRSTMRGQSNGLTDIQNSQHGLNKDYITNWSYGKSETFTFLIPNFNGGESYQKLPADSYTGRKLSEMGAPNVAEILSQYPMPIYWGSQPSTSGPVYLGAIVCLLFIFSLFIVDKRFKWWLLPVIILTLMLAWGKNFMWLTDWFVDHVPMYNKFRTVSMMLVATGFAITLMAILGLKEVFNEKNNKQKFIKPLLISTAIVGGLSLIFALIPSLAGSFINETADSQFQGQNAFLRETLAIDRASMLRTDAWRSLAFVILSAGVIFLYLKNYLKTGVTYAFLGALILFDLIPVDKRYLNDNNFETKRKFETLVQPSAADNFILQDKSQYRVLDATTDIFNNAAPSYFHKNIGGYHAAKLRRYQELIERHLGKEIGQLFGAFGKVKTADQLQPVMNGVLDSLGVLNMLNLKYIIYNKESAPVVNAHANGNAWFVKNIVVAKNADQEMQKLGEINTKDQLVIDESLAGQMPKQLIPDTTAHITLTSYEPNHLIYSFTSKSDQVAVFSEIYYNSGWNAYINGEKVPYVRVDYLLRGMSLKAGTYNIEFKFDPLSYKWGNRIATVSSLLMILAAISYLVVYLLKLKKEKK